MIIQFKSAEDYARGKIKLTQKQRITMLILLVLSAIPFLLVMYLALSGKLF